MGCIPILGACIATIGINYADLPTTTSAYSEDKTWDVSRFYDQKIPNFRAGGYYALDNNDAIFFNIDTGVHTKKLDTASIGLEYKKVVALSDSWTLTGAVGVDYNFSKNKPCVDSENRQYYCGNLTAWKDYKDKETHEDTYKASINLRYTW